MKISERIALAREKAKISQLEFSTRVGVSRFQVIKWESGRDEPSASRLAKICEVLGVSVDWLLTGKQSLEEKPLTYEKLMKPREYEYAELPKMHKLPLVGSIAANHLPTFAEAKETELVDVRFARANHYCLKVKGQSMKPTIMEGDVCIVEKVYYAIDELLEEIGPADKSIWKGLHRLVVCAIVDDEDPILKRMNVTDRKDTGFKIWLRGDNPKAEQIEITKENRLKVVGIVRSIMRDPLNFE